MATWGFLTNHAHVLIQIARNPRSTVREIALTAGITERATHAVLKDLRLARIITAQREGRQNVHWVDASALAQHRPWGATAMEIPDALVHATLRGLARLAGEGAVMHEQRVPCPGAASSPASATASPPDAMRRWGFLTSHALILVHVTQHPHSTVREIALAVGMTERAAHSVLQDLRDAGIIECERNGRRNSYTVSFEHLSGFRREGTAPGLVPDAFVSSLIDALLPLQSPEFPALDDEPHPLG